MPSSFLSRLTLSALVLLGVPQASIAQQRPLTTEDPDVIGAGRMLVEAGVETGRDARYPLSGLAGNRVSLPVGISFGLGNVGELQIDTGYQWMGIDSRSDAPFAGAVSADRARTSDVLDVTVGTKVRMLSETPTRPSVGVRFATRLPNASNESGLGLDTTDFFFSLLVGKTVGPLRVVGNAGLGILGDPLAATAQKDQFVFGVSVARALTKEVDVVGEVAGRSDWSKGTPPPGLESRAELRGAVRYTRGRSRFDAGLLIGLATESPSFGLTAGVTIVGQAGKP
jgi:hypothetical protein